MPVRLKKYFRQWMVYWAKTGSLPNGQSKFAAPLARRCRWDDSNINVVEESGRAVIYKTHIMADEDIVDGSLLIKVPEVVTKGVAKDLKPAACLDWVKKTLKIQYPAVPTTKEGAREANTISRTGDIKARPFLFEVFLG